MGRKRWRERRGNPLRGAFDIDPWRPHDPEPEEPKPEPSPRLVEHNTRVLEAFKAFGFSSADVRAPRILCGADLGDGLTCRRVAGHERVGPDCSTMTVDQERAVTERALNGGTSLIASYDEAVELAAAEVLDGNSYTLNGERIDPRRVTPQPDGTYTLDDLPPVSNPAPGLWEIVTGKPLPSYRELVERGRRAEHPTYDLLNVQSTRAPQLSSAEACDRLAASIGRTQLARRITEVLPPALASQLALAVDEAVRRGIAEHVATERAVLAGMAEGAQARLQQSIEDQKRSREATAERFTTPSRLS